MALSHQSPSPLCPALRKGWFCFRRHAWESGCPAGFWKLAHLLRCLNIARRLEGAAAAWGASRLCAHRQGTGGRCGHTEQRPSATLPGTWDRQPPAAEQAAPQLAVAEIGGSLSPSPPAQRVPKDGPGGSILPAGLREITARSAALPASPEPRASPGMELIGAAEE